MTYAVFCPGLRPLFREVQQPDSRLEPLPVGAHCAVNIDIIGPASRLKIRVEGEVARVEEDGVALIFSKIDCDSMSHLRHLIKIHAEDPETIDEEYFQELFEI